MQKPTVINCDDGVGLLTQKDLYICHEAWSFSMQVQPRIAHTGTHELLQLIHRNHSPYSPELSLYDNRLLGALKQHMG